MLFSTRGDFSILDLLLMTEIEMTQNVASHT
jgi:hypothetical protein